MIFFFSFVCFLKLPKPGSIFFNNSVLLIGYGTFSFLNANQDESNIVSLSFQGHVWPRLSARVSFSFLSRQQ